MAKAGPRITFVRGDITQQDTDAIVNAANGSLLGGGGVDGAIHAAAGPSVLEECEQIRATSHPGGLPPGEAVTTGAGSLTARYIIHVVGPSYYDDPDPARTLAAAHTAALREADKVGAQSVAFPAISTGAYGYPLDEAAKVAVETVRNADTNVKEVRFLSFDDQTHAAFSSKEQ